MTYVLMPDTQQVVARTLSGPTAGFTEHYRYELGTGRQFKVDVPANVRMALTDTAATQGQLRELYERNLVLTNGLRGKLSESYRQLLAAQMTNVNADALRVSEGTLAWIMVISVHKRRLLSKPF